MFLAGNGFITTNMGQPKHPMQAPASKLAPADWTLASQSMNMSFSNIPSPLSVSSHTIDHSAKKDEVKVSKTLSRSTSIANKVEPSRVIPSMGSAAASAMISSGILMCKFSKQDLSMLILLLSVHNILSCSVIVRFLFNHFQDHCSYIAHYLN